MTKYLIIFLLFWSQYLLGQTGKQSFDLIIVIDDQIAVSSIFDVSIKSISKGDTTLIAASYFPGNLELIQKDYSFLNGYDKREILLCFSYNEYSGQKHQVYNYVIEIKNEWLSDKFNIIRIYNLNKRKYRNVFLLEEKLKRYVYELDSPTYGFKLIRK